MPGGRLRAYSSAVSASASACSKSRLSSLTFAFSARASDLTDGPSGSRLTVLLLGSGPGLSPLHRGRQLSAGAWGLDSREPRLDSGREH
jgi:hypothetical protein